jgi:hypothetical protein
LKGALALVAGRRPAAKRQPTQRSRVPLRVHPFPLFEDAP